MEEKDVRLIRSLASHSGDRVGSAMPKNIAEMPRQADAGPPACPICNDTGWKSVRDGVNHRVTRCNCANATRTKYLIEQAKFPPRYEDCDLASYDTDGAQRGLAVAKMAAEKFIANYPLDKVGLLLIGPSGAGKTHLSVAILKQLIVTKWISCLFCDYRELLKQIQNSYNP